jgi:hypothetical protein
MRLSAHATVAALLLFTLTALRAEPVASASDIDKAMNLLPPDVQKDLPLPADARNKLPPPPPMSLHCRQLRAQIDAARYTPEPKSHDIHSLPPTPYARQRMKDEAPAEGWRINAYGSNSSAAGQGSHYDLRARLEAQFERECRQ